MRFLRTRGRIRREAADWVARLGAGGDQEDLAGFRQWYEADRRHADAYDRLAAIWSAAGRVRPSPAAEAPRERSVGWGRPVGLALAASLVAAIALVAILLSGSRWLPGSGTSAEQSFSLASGIGEIKQVDLPDGSRVVLDSASRIDIRFSATERRLVLGDGRARFIVAHETRPFIVSAASSEVIATGTVFDVSLIRNRLAVYLLEGSVEVRQANGSRGGGVHRLAPGQKVVIGGGGAPAVRQLPARGDASWPRHMLEFDDTPLEEAVALANRYSRVQLRIVDERTRSLRVTGAYRAGDVAGFARSLAAAFGLRLETQPDGSLLLAHPEADAR